MNKYKLIIGFLIFVILVLLVYIYVLNDKELPKVKIFSSLNDHISYAIKYGDDIEEAFGQLRFKMTKEEVISVLNLMRKGKNLWKEDIPDSYKYRIDFGYGDAATFHILTDYCNSGLYRINLSGETSSSFFIKYLIDMYEKKYGQSGWYGYDDYQKFIISRINSFTISRIDGNRLIEIHCSQLEYFYLISNKYENLKLSAEKEDIIKDL